MATISIDPQKIAEICVRNDIVQLALFGSGVRGEARADSDIDLLAKFSRPKSLLSVVSIQRQLTEALGRPVDLLTEPAISPYLRERILSELQVIYNA